jgi:hypothetical protein
MDWPYWYLRYLLERLPDAMTEDDFKACCHSTFNHLNSTVLPVSHESLPLTRWGSLSVYLLTILPSPSKRSYFSPIIALKHSSVIATMSMSLCLVLAIAAYD